MITLEIAVYSIEGALRAQQAGADRIELCADPGAGGTTPSWGTIEVVRQNISTDLYVMLRPRGGDFYYSSYEFHAMKRDLVQVQKLSADGVVFGILTREGRIDVKRCREVIERARPLKVTCHRAFDRTRDALEALDDCIEAGFDRILTSGQKTRAVDGIAVLRALNERAAGKIGIMPGAGIDPTSAAAIVGETGVSELHLSAKAFRASEMTFLNTDLASMGTDALHEFEVRTVDAGLIRQVREAALKATRR